MGKSSDFIIAQRANRILAGAIIIIFAIVLLIWLTNRSLGGPVTGTSPALEQNKVLTPKSQTETTPSTANRESTVSPSMQIDPQKNYVAKVVTSAGTISLELNASQTPETVGNFVNLSQKHFYDGTIFHRVIKGFMIQGGDPKGDGSGGPGYTFADEPFEGEYLRGTLAMANAGPSTNGSQFFIMQEDNPSLPKIYVIFGKVVAGLEVVDKIANAAVGPNEFGENSKPLNPVMLESITIQAK